MKQYRKFSPHLLIISLLAFFIPFSAYAAEPYTESFSSEAGWTWGYPQGEYEICTADLPPLGKQCSLIVQGLASPIPRLYTGAESSAFQGNYQNVSEVTLNLKTSEILVPNQHMRYLTIMLIHGDTAAYWVSPWFIPNEGEPAKTFTFTIPNNAKEAIEAGWELMNDEDLSLPPSHTLQEVISDVEVLAFSYGDPTLLYAYNDWDITVSEISIK